MRRLLIAIAAAATAAAPAIAQKKPEVDGDSMRISVPGKAAAAAVIRVTASVEAIDHAARTVMLKTPRGDLVTLDVGPEVKNFQQIKAGDFVVVRYAEALSLGAGAVRTVSVVADVVAVDPKGGTITLRGPKQTVDIRVRDKRHFEVVKVGDQVLATYQQAVAVSIDPAEKPAPKKG